MLIVSAALLASVRRPSPISGDINFDGIAKTNTSNLATATSFTSISGVTVVPVEDGNYTGTSGQTVTFTPFSFSAASCYPALDLHRRQHPYWFDATSITIVTQIKDFLNFGGFGMAYDDRL